MSDAGGTWTEDRVELLKKLWSEGYSASQIAAEMGGVTRNAVIGKVHRLGLSGRGKTNSTSAQRPRKPRLPESTSTPTVRGNTALAPKIAPGPVIQPLPELNRDDDVVVPLAERVTIMELRESMCRFPLGDPTSSDFRFCGAQAINGLPYCTHHAQIAYIPTAERKRLRA